MVIQHAKEKLETKRVFVPDAESGLPDGLFSNQKSQFGQILEGLRWENVAIFYGHLEYVFDGHLGYFMTLWYILCSFGKFFPVLVPCTKKNLATLRRIMTNWVG
jgi:hypothetical protein